MCFLNLILLQTILSLVSGQSWINLVSTANQALGPPISFGGRAIVAPDGNFILCGGYSARNDVWSLNPVTKKWTNMTRAGPMPPVRGDHTAVLTDNNQIIIFGGMDPEGLTSFVASWIYMYADVWKLDLATYRWTNMNPVGTGPDVSTRHSANFDSVGNDMIVYGSNSLDLWAYNVGSNNWRTLTQRNGPSNPRDSHGAVLTKKRELYIYKGYIYPNGNPGNDLWKFDLKTSNWTLIIPNIPNPLPKDLSCVAITSADEIIVYGGLTAASATTSEAWRYNTTSNRFFLVNVNGTIPPGRTNAACAMTTSDQLVVFGGAKDQMSVNLLNDAWMLPLGSNMTSAALTERSSTVSNSNLPVSISGVPTPTGTFRPQSTVTTQRPAVITTSGLFALTVSTNSGGSVDISSSSPVVSSEGATESSSITIVVTDAFSLQISDIPIGDEDILVVVNDDSSSTASRPVSNAKLTTTNTSMFTYIILGASVFIICCILTPLGYYIIRKGSPSRFKLTTNTTTEVEATEPTMTLTTAGITATQTSQITGLTTYQMSSYGLSIPGYLQVSYSTDVRSGKVIAQGGYGKIMLVEAVNPNLAVFGAQVVVKELIGKKGPADQKQIESFMQEVSIMALLGSHKNIVRLLGYTETPYTIIMKFYPNGSLENWIFSSKQRKSKVITRSFMRGIAEGLAHCHANGFVHADIKPQNILIDVNFVSSVTLE